jgi:lactobin A/cerein 7B family class IIb bacteriocin
MLATDVASWSILLQPKQRSALMTPGNIQSAEQGLRELTANEVDDVSGGFFPILCLAFAVGFDIGFIATYGFGSTGLE